MTQAPDIDTVLDVAKQIMTAAGCASLVTVDESGLPSARPVRTFPSDDTCSKIAIPTDRRSRKTHHVRNSAFVVLSYVDTPNRGYVTMIGDAVLNDDPEAKERAWKEPFSTFWPGGPESDDYLLIEMTPRRLEARSYTQGIADNPTSWAPVVLEATNPGEWKHAA